MQIERWVERGKARGQERHDLGQTEESILHYNHDKGRHLGKDTTGVDLVGKILTSRFLYTYPGAWNFLSNTLFPDTERLTWDSLLYCGWLYLIK